MILEPSNRRTGSKGIDTVDDVFRRQINKELANL